MPRSSLLSDELVRQLVAVGQVDVLVGLPTFNHATTVGAIVRAVHVGLARHFPRERTVFINPDGGSGDGTPDLVRRAPLADEETRGSTTLRTTHRVSAPYHGLPGRSNGVRVVLAAADLLQAKAVVVLDPDVSNVEPGWIEALARPVWDGAHDAVLPIHPRHRADGPLLVQLVRPLLGAAYGRRLRSNLARSFSCSGALAARLLRQGPWDRDPARPAFDVWLVATLLAEQVRLAQAHLGPCVYAPRADTPGLPELFQHVVGAAFECLEAHADRWRGREGVEPVPALGEPRHAAGPPLAVDTAPLVERFRLGVRELVPLLGEILSPGTRSALEAVAASGDGAPDLGDALWAATVMEFAAAHHRRVMNAEHLTQALVPLYLGRTASFLAELARDGEFDLGARLAALDDAFAAARPRLVERWGA